MRNKDVPVIIVHCTWTGGQLLSYSIVPPVPTDGVFPQAQEGFFIAKHTAVVRSTGFC